MTQQATANQIRFFYNGIKVEGHNDGKLQKGHWSFIEEWTMGNGRVVPNQLTLYARNYRRFQGIHDVFTVENDSDSMTDYFEEDRVRIYPDHELFQPAVKAYVKQWRKGNVRACKHIRDEDRRKEAEAELEAKVQAFEAKWVK